MDTTAEIATVDSSPDVENSQMELIAKMAAQALSQHYPAHLWMVGWAPGRALVVKNMAIDDGRYGFTVDAHRDDTVRAVERLMVCAGGELFQRCGVPRGAWDGEMLTLRDKT